jgi:membrane protein DedA with SNARE-associated domain
MVIGQLHDVIAIHGYVVVGLIVALESMGLPLPGETTLVTAAIYAGTTHRLDIFGIVAAAAAGAIAGDNAGFWIGRRYGAELVQRYGHLVRIDEKRVRLGQYLFARHGGKVVFFGRFAAILRTLAALLAGINRMPARRFMIFNVAGGIIWAAVFGFGAFVLGEGFHRVEGRLAAIGVVLVLAGVVGAKWFMTRHEAALQAAADRFIREPSKPLEPSSE